MDTFVSAPTAAPARILIVDDHPNTASMLARALGRFKTPVEILTARNGQEALTIIGDSVVDVLITDFMMPGLNGLELIEKLRGGHEPAHTVLITAYDSPGLAATARRLKINDYLVKPVQPEKIRGIVSRALDGMQMTPAPLAEPASRSQFKVLIADDRPDNVQLLAARLGGEGYAFVTATDGEETLAKVRADMPDLVLLDVNMPNKDGFQVLTEMRADPQVAHIPVIMLTAARIEPKDVRLGLDVGADDYITKPFDWRELAARVRTKLRVKQAEDALRRRNRELGLLPEIGQDLSARRDVEELAAITLRRSVDVLGAADGHLVVFNPDGAVLHQVFSTREGSPWEWQDSQKRLLTEGVVAHVLTTQRAAVIDNTEGDPRWLKLPDDTARSAIAVPLLSRRGVIGVLTLSHQQRASFTQDHLTLLQAIASQAAIAIENAQFYAIEHKRVKELVALNQLAREISLFARSAELFDSTPQLIHETLGYPAVSLWLTDGGAPVLHSLARSDENMPLASMALGPQQVAASGQPVHFSGGVEHPAAGEPEEGAAAPAGVTTQTTIAVPLFWDSRFGSVLAIHSSQPNAFQESDRVLLETLAAQIASALERIRLFESVEQEERRLAAVLRGAADAILVIDADGRLKLMNPAGRQLFTDVEAKLGQPLPENRGYNDLLQLLRQARDAHAPQQGEIAWPDKRTFAASITPIEDGGQVAVLHDVTHFKDLERVKNEFIATASHDLKNPLTAVFGFSHLLEKAGPLNGQQADYVSRIQKAAMQMLELVQNLLELARIDLGVVLNLETCSIAALLADVADEFQSQAAAKAQVITLEPMERCPPARADAVRLRQVARNLLSNAIKYTPQGGRITIAAELYDATSVQVTVQDTGLGIPPADLPFVFDKFYRVHTDDTKDIDGNGLGLAIVKAIVEQHGGQVFANSTLGEGSRFGFTVPAATPAASSVVNAEMVAE